MVCPKCHTEIDGTGSFCPYCGTKLNDRPPDRGAMWEAVFPCLLAVLLLAGTLWAVWSLR